MTFLYLSADGGYKVKSDAKMGDVRTPNYVYDLWLPLLGVECIGVYSVYRRIQRNGIIRGLSLEQLASACRLGKATLKAIHEKLAACKFIAIRMPTQLERVKHYTIEITINEAPTVIDPNLIEKYGRASGYEPLTRWLVDPSDDDAADLTGPSRGSNQVVEQVQLNPLAGLTGPAVIESSIVETSIVETSMDQGGIVGAHEKNLPPGKPTNYVEKVVDSQTGEPITRITLKPRAVQEKELKTSPSPSSAPPPPAPTDEGMPEDVMQAIGTLCYDDSEAWVKASGDKIESAALILLEKEPDLDGARIVRFGEFWRDQDWRWKKNGSVPTPRQIVEEWKRFQTWSAKRADADGSRFWHDDGPILDDYIEDQITPATAIPDEVFFILNDLRSTAELYMNKNTAHARINSLIPYRFEETDEQTTITFTTATMPSYHDASKDVRFLEFAEKRMADVLAATRKSKKRPLRIEFIQPSELQVKQ